MQCEMTELHLCWRISDHTVKPEPGSGAKSATSRQELSIGSLEGPGSRIEQRGQEAG